MKFVMINKESLEIKGQYEADQVDNTSAHRDYSLAEPICCHLEVGELVHFKAELVDDVITLVHDAAKEAAVIVQVKADQVSTSRAIRNADIDAECYRVFGTSDYNAAQADVTGWILFRNKPEMIGLSQEQIDANLAKAEAYAIWRLNRIAVYYALKAEIMG
jgi:hypothetical protein